MELLRQGLRMTFYGNGDHSGGLWKKRTSAADRLDAAPDGAAWCPPLTRDKTTTPHQPLSKEIRLAGGAHVA